MIRSNRPLTLLAALAAGATAALAMPAAPVAAQQAPATPRIAERGWVGISVEVLASQNPAGTQTTTVTVTEVGQDSPAARAGIRAGDILVSVNGAQSFPSDLRPGDTVRVTVRRDGRMREMLIAAAPRPTGVETAPAWTLTFRADSMVDRMYRAMDSLRLRIGAGEHGELHVVDLQRLAGAARAGVPDLATGAAPWMTPESRDAPLRYFFVPDRLGDSLRAELELPARGERADARPFRLLRAPDDEMPPPDGRPAGFRPLDVYMLGQNRAAGAEVVDLRPELAEYFGVEGGVLVVDVPEGTPAALAGIQPGDVLTDVGRAPIRSIQELRAGLAVYAAEIPVTVIRKGRKLQLLLAR